MLANSPRRLANQSDVSYFLPQLYIVYTVYTRQGEIREVHVNRSQLFVLLISGLVFATVAQAQTPNSIQITVNTNTGVRQHSAPTLGQVPLTLEKAMQAAGVPFTSTWFPSVPGYAAMIIDGDPDKTTGGFEASFWWACINGYSSAAGLQTLVKSGDQVEWTRMTQGKCPKDIAR